MIDHTSEPKRCPKCEVTYSKPSEAFSKNKRTKDGYNGWCKACYKVWREANKETLREKKHEYYLQNIDRHRENRRRWRQENPEKKKASDRRNRRNRSEHRKAYNRRLYQEKPEVFREGRQRYWRRFKSLPHQFTEDDWAQCLAYWNHRCAVCRSEDAPQMDHWIPVSAEVEPHPGTTPGNILPLCHSCNSSKFNKDGYQWLVELYGRDQADTIYETIQLYFQSVSVGERT